MTAIRRLYIYLVAAASLGVLVTGLAQVGAATIELVLGGGAIPTTYRSTIATFGAAIIVGLPLWLLHWSLAQRMASRDAEERAATLRRLYLYGVLSGLLITVGILAARFLNPAIVLVLRLDAADANALPVRIARTAWELAVVTLFWVYTFRIAAADRAAVGEVGGSATLRRWYAYGAQLVAFLLALDSAAALLDTVLVNAFAGPQVVRADAAVAAGVAQTLVGLAIWLFHRRWTARDPLEADDRHSTLRAVHGFWIVGVSVAVTLANLGRILHYGLARALGVAQPEGLPGDALAALGLPFARVVVFGIAWAFIRWSLARDASGTEAERQAGVRRLCNHLVAFVALATLALGATGLLWTLVDQLFGPGVPVTPLDVRDEVSTSVTLTLLGLVVWLLHWRAAPPPTERLALSRRLYVFASLLISVLALLGSGVYLASQVLNQLLAVGGDRPALQIGHALAVALVALAVAGYHVRVLRADGALRAGAAPEPPSPAPVDRAAPIVVEIVGATEAEVREALAALPASARYSVRAAG